MIKFEDSEIIQILPERLKNMPEAEAVSYAIGNAVKKIVKYARLTSVYAVIDQLPEQFLDLMALESRVQYYDEKLEIGKKRELLKQTLVWYQKAGTPGAVQELVQTVFGVGEVQEWFEYGGKPYCFRITTNADTDPQTIAKFEKIIQSVKNTRSHLERVTFSRRVKTAPLYSAVGVYRRVVMGIGWEDNPDGSI